MKRPASLVVLVVLAASVIAAAAGLISKAQAERDALKAVNGGSVIQAVLGTQGRLRIWSVDIAQPTHEYEVHVDAHAGAILKIIVQPSMKPRTLPAEQFWTQARKRRHREDLVSRPDQA